MKRRTRLRKQGLPADPPRTLRAQAPNLLDLSAQLAQALTTQTFMPHSRIRALAADTAVLSDVQAHGVQAVVTSLTRYGMTPSEVRWRFG